jgi:excisionase family DNA binding protein
LGVGVEKLGNEMSGNLLRGKDLLDTEDVAEYLGVGQVTVWRWCREGSLPALKIGKHWRVRREALEEFLRRSERSETLVGRLGSFLEVPDSVLAIAQTYKLMYQLDAGFFRAGDARGGTLIKYIGGEVKTSVEEQRDQLERNGLEVARLEGEDRLRIVSESGAPGQRVDELRRILDGDESGRSVWVNFNWEGRIYLEAALRQQEEIRELVEGTQLVVKSTVLEEALDEWPGATLRRAQVVHAGTIWVSESGLALNRVLPPPPSI